MRVGCYLKKSLQMESFEIHKLFHFTDGDIKHVRTLTSPLMFAFFLRAETKLRRSYVFSVFHHDQNGIVQYLLATVCSTGVSFKRVIHRTCTSGTFTVSSAIWTENERK